MGGISILASIIGIFFVRVQEGSTKIMNAMYKGTAVSAILAAIGFIPVMFGFAGQVGNREQCRERRERYGP